MFPEKNEKQEENQPDQDTVDDKLKDGPVDACVHGAMFPLDRVLFVV